MHVVITVEIIIEQTFLIEYLELLLQCLRLSEIMLQWIGGYWLGFVVHGLKLVVQSRWWPWGFWRDNCSIDVKLDLLGWGGLIHIATRVVVDNRATREVIHSITVKQCRLGTCFCCWMHISWNRARMEWNLNMVPRRLKQVEAARVASSTLLPTHIHGARDSVINESRYFHICKVNGVQGIHTKTVKW